jgi:unsaturated rhamnogalacturonyl hydrolase
MIKSFVHQLVTCLMVVPLLPACAQTKKQVSDKAPMSVRMSESDMIRNPDPTKLDFAPAPKWNYTNGLVCSAIEKVWKKTGDVKYYNYIKRYADQMINEDGTIKTYKLDDYNIDKVNSGKFLFALQEKTGDPKYEKAIRLLRDQMRTHPRTSDGGFWHKKAYPNQMWLDGLYMATPFLAQYARDMNEPELFNDVALQIHLIDKHTYDSASGLFYHGWDESREQEWANKTDGKSPHVWGRAMGWFAMALVDVLDFLPNDHPKRAEILTIADKMAKALVRYQDPVSGVWYQVVDLPKREGNYRESSASAMFSYFLVKGATRGYINKKYLDTGKKGYEGILENFIVTAENGLVSITNVCAVAGLGGTPYRSGTFEYYVTEPKRDNDPKAVGPFIMLALEMESLKN